MAFKVPRKRAFLLFIEETKEIDIGRGNSGSKRRASVAKDMVDEALVEGPCSTKIRTKSSIRWPAHLTDHDWHLTVADPIQCSNQGVEVTVESIIVHVCSIYYRVGGTIEESIILWEVGVLIETQERVDVNHEG